MNSSNGKLENLSNDKLIRHGGFRNKLLYIREIHWKKFRVNRHTKRSFWFQVLSSPFSTRAEALDLLAVYTLSNPNVCIITVFILITPPDL